MWNRGNRPHEWVQANPVLKRVVDGIATGAFSPSEPGLFRPLMESLLHNDEYMVLADFQAYIDCQAQVELAYRDVGAWTRMSILNAARSGFFSSDRTIREYAKDIWGLRPVAVP
jgi:starch phosphorylase